LSIANVDAEYPLNDDAIFVGIIRSSIDSHSLHSETDFLLTSFVVRYFFVFCGLVPEKSLCQHSDSTGPIVRTAVPSMRANNRVSPDMTVKEVQSLYAMLLVHSGYH